MSDKIFDDYKDLKRVDCEECERYWIGQCDGVQKGSEKPCKSFLATRRVIILDRIKSLRTQIKWVYVGILIEAILLLLLLWSEVFG